MVQNAALAESNQVATPNPNPNPNPNPTPDPNPSPNPNPNQVAVEALGAIRTVQANTGEVGEARFFASNINRFLRVVLVTVITQTVVIFTQLGLSKARHSP